MQDAMDLSVSINAISECSASALKHLLGGEC